MSTPGNVPPQAAALHAEALRLGLQDGVDFGVAFVTPQVGSEAILFTGTREGFVVLYQDCDDVRPLFGSAGFDEAARTFLEEACWLAASRDRGPYAGRARPTGTETWTLDQVTDAFTRRTQR